MSKKHIAFRFFLCGRSFLAVFYFIKENYSNINSKKDSVNMQKHTYSVNSAKPSTPDCSCLKYHDWHHLCYENSPTS